MGGNPFETSAIYTLIHYLERKWGVFFPRGGTGALVRGLVRLFEDLGGELRLALAGRPASPARTATAGSAHRVSSANAGLEDFDLVVSNADVHHTYKHLYGQDPRGARRRPAASSAWTGRCRSSSSTSAPNRRYPGVAHHTVVFGPRYEGLLRDIFHGDALPEDFSLYLHAPTVTDPSLAPPGCEAFYVLSPVPHLGMAEPRLGEGGAGVRRPHPRLPRAAAARTCAGTS